MRKDKLLLMAAFLCAMSLGACGVHSVANGGATTVSPSPSATMSAPVATNTTSPTLPVGSAAVNGCQVQQPPTPIPQADIQILPPATLTGSQAFHLQRNQIVAIQLLAGYRWTLTSTMTDGALQLETPAGWYNPAIHDCTWDFKAVGSGEMTIHFDGEIVCPPPKTCPVSSAALDYDVSVA